MIVELRKAKPEVGSILKIRPDKKRDNSKQGKESSYPTTYIPVDLIDAEGTPHKLKLAIVGQLIAGNAKPYGKNEEEIRKADSVYIPFRKFNVEDLKISDYHESEKEAILKNNEELIKAFEIISEEYLHIVKNEILDDVHELGIIDDPVKINVANFVQSERKLTADEKKQQQNKKSAKIKLDNSIYRIRLNGDKDTKLIGRNNFNTKKFEYTVFDFRKKINTKDTKSVYKYEPAKLKNSNGKLLDISVSNAKHFITYLSLVGGVINFENISITKNWISLKNSFLELYVSPHKPMKQETMSEEDLAAMNVAQSFNEDDMVLMDEPSDDPDTTNNKTANTKKEKEKTKSKPIVVKTGKKNSSMDAEQEQELNDDIEDEDNTDATDTTDKVDESDEEETDEPESTDVDLNTEKEDKPPKIQNKLDLTKDKKSTSDVKEVKEVKEVKDTKDVKDTKEVVTKKQTTKSKTTKK